MGKGEIARYKQFLLFPQRFQKVCFPGASKAVIVWEWVKANYFVENGLNDGIKKTLFEKEKRPLPFLLFQKCFHNMFTSGLSRPGIF